MGVACTDSYIVYNMMYPNNLKLLNFKTIVSTQPIARCASRSRAPQVDKKKGSKRKYQLEQVNLPPYLPEFQNIRTRCEYCQKEDIGLKTYVKCTE